MATLLLAALVILLGMLGLALGLFFGRPPLKGSCGGFACSGLGCETCPNRKPAGTDR